MQGKSQYLRVAYDQLNAGAVEKYVREEKRSLQSFIRRQPLSRKTQN
jgi:hypothetical protein